MRSVRVSCQTIALYQGRPVFGFHTTVVSRWLVTPIAARSAAERFACRNAPAMTVFVRSADLEGIVLDPPGLRHDLLVLELMPRDLDAARIEHHEPRARRSLIQRPDVLLHCSSTSLPASVA